jgi:hypothetical protein
MLSTIYNVNNKGVELKSSLLLLIVIICSSPLSSLAQVFTPDHVTAIKLTKYEYGTEKHFGLNSNYYYFSSISKNTTSSKFTVSKVDLQTDKVSELDFYIDEGTALNTLSLKQKMYIDDNTAIFIGFKSLYIFKRNLNEYRLDKIKHLKESYSDIFPLNDSVVVLSQFYDYHVLDKENNIKVHTFNFNSDTIYELLTEKEIVGDELSHLVNNYIHVNNGQVVIADPLNYQVKLYSISEKKITLLAELEQPQKSNAYEIFELKCKPLIPKYYAIKPRLYMIDSVFMHNEVQRIEKIYLIDSTTLLVSSLNHRNRKYRTIDIWSIKDGQNYENLFENVEYNLSDSMHYGDAIKLQYSLPLFTYKNCLLELSYFRYRPLNKPKLNEFSLLKHHLILNE